MKTPLTKIQVNGRGSADFIGPVEKLGEIEIGGDQVAGFRAAGSVGAVQFHRHVMEEIWEIYGKKGVEEGSFYSPHGSHPELCRVLFTTHTTGGAVGVVTSSQTFLDAVVDKAVAKAQGGRIPTPAPRKFAFALLKSSVYVPT